MAFFYTEGTRDTSYREASVDEVFPFLRESGHIVSVVGAGGKSSLIDCLASFVQKQGRCVLVSTTTHIFQPPARQYAKRQSDLERIWKEGRYAVIGAPAPRGRLGMPETDWFWKAASMADLVFLEADGSRQLPAKVPAAHEPVLLPQSDLLIGVQGLRAAGGQIQDVCLRAETACELLGKMPDMPMTKEDLAWILASVDGCRKQAGNRLYYAVLNQCDTEPDRQAALCVMRQLKEAGIENRLFSCLR